MFETKRMVPWTTFNTSEIYAPCAYHEDVEDSAGCGRGLLVHCKVDVESRAATNGFLAWGHCWWWLSVGCRGVEERG
jgi:hypothetical protein